MTVDCSITGTLLTILISLAPLSGAATGGTKQTHPSAWDLLRKQRQERTEPLGPKGAGRVVHFPKDRFLGILKVQDETGEHPTILNTDFDYESFGSATGDVTAPAGKRLLLYVGERTWKNLSHLSRLRPDDLYSVYLSGSYYGGPKPGDYCLKHFAALTGLKQLHLNSTNITYRGIQHLTGLKNLNYLLVSSERLDNRGIPYIAELSSLETLVFGGRLPTTDCNILHPWSTSKSCSSGSKTSAALA